MSASRSFFFIFFFFFLEIKFLFHLKYQLPINFNKRTSYIMVRLFDMNWFPLQVKLNMILYTITHIGMMATSQNKFLQGEGKQESGFKFMRGSFTHIKFDQARIEFQFQKKIKKIFYDVCQDICDSLVRNMHMSLFYVIS